MLKIYHNARCKKSREGLEILKNSDKEFEIKEYLKEPLSEEELESLINKLDIAPIQLVRKNEKIWKEEYKDKDLSDRELITVMTKHPKLIERPIVEDDKKAVIGRPPSEIEKLL
ncbi:arsenate reductase (glutaredoxin) [Christiangramia crocea]|uniref:Arsenate reductase (Glutaredoxin) n=1 Tax=Christiangramia crocea TaxID=2904124 RepID=A0A9X1UWP9_9FLAO|nr:arsenate reductase (glutaredoxin) [Gramella crocea]MCG9971765.1 arsenate reductase (glutaredoxin) [Gramella crocea]